ncbi:hypothetical protein [Streptomyces albogriseolus]|uniref:hypothetical protein n=1 Tax=Streptomyces albogriseolus TaxID=1887 RepID=UPI0033A68968
MPEFTELAEGCDALPCEAECDRTAEGERVHHTPEDTGDTARARPERPAGSSPVSAAS